MMGSDMISFQEKQGDTCQNYWGCDEYNMEKKQMNWCSRNNSWVREAGRERFLTTTISEKIQGKGDASREELGGCDSDALC